MDESNVDYSAAKNAMERYGVSSEKLLHGINNESGRIPDPYIDNAFVLIASVDEGLPIEIHCVATKTEEMCQVLHVSRVQN